MKRTNLTRTLGSLIFSLAGIWLSSAAMGQASLTLLQEAFPGVALAYLGPQPKDYVPITVSSARTWGNPNGIEVAFTAAVDPATATNAANYTVTPGIVVQTAVMGSNAWTVRLTTTTMADAVLHTLAVANVQDLANPVHTIPSGTIVPILKAQGVITRKVFTNIGGNWLNSLTNNTKFPNSPDAVDWQASFEAPSNQGDYYGEQMIGYICPPVTGDYQFFIASDNEGLLYLSTDATPANKVAVASVPDYTAFRQWNKYASQTSGYVKLQAGRIYYVEALMAESTGDDSLSVTWRMRGMPAPTSGDAPIPGGFLSSITPSGPASVVSAPMDVTVSERQSASFSVVAGGTPLYTYQWRKNGISIPGASATNYVVASASYSDNNALFSVVVSNWFSSITSSVARLTVLQDTVPPQVVSAATLVGSTNVGIRFSKFMDSATATNPANYTLSIGGTVTSATLRADGQSVSLGVTALAFTNYILRLNNLKDYAGNMLAPDTPVTVTAVAMENTDVGIPGDPLEIGSTFSSSPGNFDVVAGGSDIWNNHDGFHFIYQLREGDFDAQVRVARLDATAYYSFAGLHVRESLYAGSREMKIVVANPSGANGYHVGYRGTTDGGSGNWPGYGTIASGGAPVPNAWIRLTRTNDLFTAWRGTNGVDWTAFAQTTMSFTGRVYVGLAACPVNNGAGQAITAWFRDYSISPAYPLPAPLDLMVKRTSDGEGAFALNDIYQAIPAGGQVLVQSANPTNPASFTVKVENDGTVMQSLVLRAMESSDVGWSTVYSLGGSNITALITGTSGFALTNLPSGSAQFVQVDLLPNDRVLGASTKSTTIRVTTDMYTRSQRDAVQLLAMNEVNYQPDMLVRRQTDVVYDGLGVYNSTGSNQTKSVTADTGTLVVYPLQLVNAGNITNAFTVVGSAGGGGWFVRYFDAPIGGSDITSEMTGGGVGVALLPGASWELRAEVTASLAVLPGMSNVLFVTATSDVNPARTDTVKMVSEAQIFTNVPQSGLYTTDADFERGTRVGTVYGGDQLTLSTESVTWPFIWVPNSNEGTVSKVDARTGAEVGRYRTCPPGVNGNPSRTTVDQYGNCWVANRQSGTVVKIGLLESGQFIDRNKNGVPDTSFDANGDGDISSNEMMPWGQDECVLYEVVLVPGKEGTFTPGTYTNGYVDNYWNPGPRGIAVDYSGNVWIGTHDSMKYYYLDGATAGILRTNDTSSLNHTAYGAVIDGNGILWSSGYKDSGQCNILRLDPTDNSMSVINFEFHTYGLGLDHQNHLFVSGHQESKLSRINVLTATREWTVDAGYLSRGVAVTDDEDVWVASSSEGNVWRFSNNGVFKGKIAVGNTPTGVSVDSNGKVWVVNDGDEYIKRIDPAIGAYGAVDLSKRIIGGLHYGYSDMTGIIARSTTGEFGTWTVIHDAVVRLTQWGVVSWNGYEPQGSSISVRVRSSDDGRIWADWETATSGAALSATPPGRFLQVEVSLRTHPGGTAPVLYDLSIQPLPQRTADLAITQTVSASIVTNEHFVTWTLFATNQGPQNARGVYVTDLLPAGVTVVGITNPLGTVVQSLGGLRWILGNLNAGSSSTMILNLLVTNAGTLTNSVALSHYEVDPVPANNLSVLTALAVANPCLPPLSGLVGWWPAEGNANDLVSTSNGVLANGATFAPGKAGLAFSFNGNGAHVDLGRRSPGTQWSLEAWVNLSAIYSGRRAIMGTEADCRDWALVVNNGELGLNVGKSGCVTIYGSGVIAATGTWYHVVGTCDGTNAAIYVNGQLKNSGTVDLNYVGSSSGFWIGGAVCCGEYIAGLVDEASLYNRALTPAEVFALYDGGSSGKCKATLAPTLQLGPGSGPNLSLSWPAMAADFHVESTTAFGTPWQPWPGIPTLAGDQLMFDIPPTNAMRFFRLKKP